MKQIVILLALLASSLTTWGQSGNVAVEEEGKQSDDIAVVTEGKQSDEFAVVAEGERVPSFTVAVTDGTTICSDSLRGKVVLITLWASWCPSCRREMAAIAKGGIDGLLDNENFVWLPIAREENPATVQRWFDKKGYTMDSGCDEQRTIYELFATQEIPRNIVVDKGGTITHHSRGYTRKGFRNMVAEIEKMLN